VGFFNYCQSREAPVEFPVSWLPRIATKKLKAFIAEEDIKELADVPDDLLGPMQQRVKECTLKGEVFFDAAAAARRWRRWGGRRSSWTSRRSVLRCRSGRARGRIRR
jgi:hypothetical protein